MTLESSSRSRHTDARERALRAARSVTLSVFALAASGCASSVSPTLDDANARAEVAVVPHDAVVDAQHAAVDAAPDTNAADTSQDCRALMSDRVAYQACCDRNMWDWHLGCEAWGPFMPPEMGA